MTSSWARWCLKSPVSRLLTQPLFRRRSKKSSKLRVTGLCVGISPGTGKFPAQMASNAENVSIWWRHHAQLWSFKCMEIFRSCCNSKQCSLVTRRWLLIHVGIKVKPCYWQGSLVWGFHEFLLFYLPSNVKLEIHQPMREDITSVTPPLIGWLPANATRVVWSQHTQVSTRKTNHDFQMQLPIGCQQSCQPIRSHIRQSRSINHNFILG